jgi:hypothetical protein
METHEMRYGKAVAQFTVWTLYAALKWKRMKCVMEKPHFGVCVV